MRTLLLAPHHDDESLFASFICLKYDPVVVTVFGISEANGVKTSVRQQELVDALLELGVSEAHSWAISDASFTDDQVEAAMIGLCDPAGIEDWDLVFAPAWERGGHPQHSLVADLADRVFVDSMVEHYTTYTSPQAVRTRTEREIEYEPEWLFRKHAALACHRSAAATPSYRHFAEDLREYLL